MTVLSLPGVYVMFRTIWEMTHVDHESQDERPTEPAASSPRSLRWGAGIAAVPMSAVMLWFASEALSEYHQHGLAHGRLVALGVLTFSACVSVALCVAAAITGREFWRPSLHASARRSAEDHVP